MKEEDKRKRGFHGNGNQHMYLLVLAMAGLFFATLSSAQEVEYSSVSFISSEDVYLLPCVYRGIPHAHGESWTVNECSTCTCANATIECVILGCQPTNCDNVIHPPGECCAMCPNIVNVSEVAPVARVTSTPKLMSGKKNRMLLNVSVGFHETDLTTGVQGEDLWNMTIWTSRNPNGEGFAYSVAKNVLNAEQRSQRHRKGKKFPKLRNIPYTLDARRMSCNDMRYICVRFEQAINPGHVNRAYVPFYFSGYPDDSVLTGCTPAPRCKLVKPKPVPTTARPTTTFPPTMAPTTIPTTWPRWTRAPTLPPTRPPTRPPTLPPTFPPTLPPRRTTRRPKLKKTKKPKRTPATLPPTLAPLTTLMLNEALAVGSTRYATLPPTVPPTTGVPYIPRFLPDDSESNEAFEHAPMYPLAPQRNSNKQRNRNRGRNRWRAERFKTAAEAAGFSSDEVMTHLKQKKKSRRREQAKRKQVQPLPFTQEQQEYRQQQQPQHQLYQQQQQQYEQQQLQYEQQRQQQYQQQQYYRQQHQQNGNRPYGNVREGQMNPLFQREKEKAIAEGTLLGPQQGWPAAYNAGYTWQQYMEGDTDYNSQER